MPKKIVKPTKSKTAKPAKAPTKLKEIKVVKKGTKVNTKATKELDLEDDEIE